MNLYRISQDDANDYETYDSAIVAAPSPSAAKKIHPDEREFEDSPYRTWASSPDLVEVEYIGKAKRGTKRGVVLASYNAG